MKYKVLSIWFKKEICDYLEFNGEIDSCSDSYGIIFDEPDTSYHNASEEEIYKVCQKFIEIGLPIMVITGKSYYDKDDDIIEKTEVFILRFNEFRIYTVDSYNFPELNNKEKEIFKFYKVMNTV